MWNFFWPILIVILSVVSFIVSILLLLSRITFWFSKDFSQNLISKIKWLVCDNNGWFVIFFIVTIVLHIITAQKWIDQPLISVWESQMALSDSSNSNDKTNKLYNSVREVIRGEENYVPVVTKPPKEPRPTYGAWLLRALLMGFFTIPCFGIYASLDEIKDAWKEHTERVQSNKSRAAEKQEKDLTIWKVLFFDIITIYGAKLFQNWRKSQKNT